MGLFLMEALRITHLFPRIATLNDRMRRRMMWIALVLLVTLAGVEAALALMRDMLIADKQALIQSLATVQQAAADRRLGRADPDRRADAARLHPAVRARVRRHPARVAHPLVAHRRRRAARRAGVGAGARAARARQRRRGACRRVLITLYDVVIVLPLMVERMVKAGMRDAALRGRRRRFRAAEAEAAMIKRLLLLGLALLAAGCSRAAAIRAAMRRRSTCWSTPREPTRRRRQGPAHRQLPARHAAVRATRSRWRGCESRSFSEKDIIAKATFDSAPVAGQRAEARVPRQDRRLPART